jgi:hypothetical protein
MSWAWNQGRDSTLYNAYDWEHLRTQLVRFAATADISIQVQSKEMQKEIADDLQKIFSHIPKIEIEKPELTLPSRQGSEWYWTSIGFQCMRRDKMEGMTVTPKAEVIISALKELGIKEAYAPIGENTLTLVINPNAIHPIHTHEFLSRDSMTSFKMDKNNIS